MEKCASNLYGVNIVAIAGPSSAVPAAADLDSDEVLSVAESDADEDTTGGDGGCTAVALRNLGFFSSKASAVLALDAQIPPLRAAFFAQGHGYDAAGIAGEQWHESVIMQAIWGAGWHHSQPSLV